jgi:hypothetical protein
LIHSATYSHIVPIEDCPWPGVIARWENELNGDFTALLHRRGFGSKRLRI